MHGNPEAKNVVAMCMRRELEDILYYLLSTVTSRNQSDINKYAKLLLRK